MRGASGPEIATLGPWGRGFFGYSCLRQKRQRAGSPLRPTGSARTHQCRAGQEAQPHPGISAQTIWALQLLGLPVPPQQLKLMAFPGGTQGTAATRQPSHRVRLGWASNTRLARTLRACHTAISLRPFCQQPWGRPTPAKGTGRGACAVQPPALSAPPASLRPRWRRAAPRRPSSKWGALGGGEGGGAASEGSAGADTESQYHMFVNMH